MKKLPSLQSTPPKQLLFILFIFPLLFSPFYFPLFLFLLFIFPLFLFLLLFFYYNLLPAFNFFLK